MKTYRVATAIGAIAALLVVAACDPPPPEAFAMAHRRAHCVYMTGSRLCQVEDSSTLEVTGTDDASVRSSNSGRVGTGGR